MTISRPARTTRPQDDLDDMLDFMIDVAHQQLDGHGKCPSFAAVLPFEGLPTIVPVDTHRDRGAPPVAFAETGYATLHEMRHDIVAGAIAQVVEITNEKTQAIRIDVEHVDGHAVIMLQPFLRRPLRRQTDYGKRRICQGHRHIWVD